MSNQLFRYLLSNLPDLKIYFKRKPITHVTEAINIELESGDSEAMTASRLLEFLNQYDNKQVVFGDINVGKPIVKKGKIILKEHVLE